MANQLTAKLSDWGDVKDLANWQALLVGNGASRSVWDKFGYPSLFDIAQEEETADRLNARDVDLFRRLGNTTNFEAVLESLLVAKSVAESLDLRPRDRIDERYSNIQRAMVAAVREVHVPWRSVTTEVFTAIRGELLRYSYVFSTNYDLLIYWAIMADDPGRFRDYFWSEQFNSSDVAIFGDATKVLYLHGALHLYHGADGHTYKEHADSFANLLELFGRRPDGVPLCITEGTSPQKLSAIGRSDYLSFALRRLTAVRGPIVVFGHSLAAVDQHVVDALTLHPDRKVAISIYPAGASQVIRDKAHAIAQLPTADLYFFDSRTHPLGATSLRVV